MYRKILVALDNTVADRELLPHIVQFAALAKSELLLLHVADGWVARNFEQLNLAESEEMREDWTYLEETAARLRGESGLKIETRLALGNPPTQILQVAEQEHCDLIALASHGHRLVGDIIHGSTIDEVRHKAHVPILVVPPRK
ncbi:UspA domain protein [Chthoniobacter flavus Ellin428]|uniref:UspA domain protein n=1 Tax=Chthoniobacter flavus Ellin428 TaxID=497964 RepID=B4CTL6_9BACT|nr:universal stress protein [Chthoniobacter flavus]EDY21890.1 UspA domain protein [Chthoniobacter flavus Ellin428]TCO89283.1 nucleotide-binding universal stress UspA family protein [Chthoniobacter flavus]